MNDPENYLDSWNYLDAVDPKQFAVGGCWVYRRGTARSVKYARSLILQSFFPLPHLCRVYAKRLGNFGYRLDASDRLKRDLGFELTAEVFALFRS